MTVGLVIPICTTHPMQAESITNARRYSLSDTPVIVAINGDMAPPAVPDGVEILTHGERFSDEADLWNWILALAVERGWDWCMIQHDDFRMEEGGWEAQLALAHDCKVALASWCTYDKWLTGAVSADHSRGYLGVIADPLTLGFRVSLFRERGCLTTMRVGFGYAAWEANGWALEQGYGVWRIRLNGSHQWLVGQNTRDKVAPGAGAGGHGEVAGLYKHILPAEVVDANAFTLNGQRFEVGAVPPAEKRRTHCGMNGYDQGPDGAVFITEAEDVR